MEINKKQTVCEWKGVTPERPDPNSVVGLAIKTIGQGIIYGLRHPENENSNGWYIWCGEYSESEDFFSPVCVEHVEDHLGHNISEYLELPPGYRFLIDGNNYEDVWFDKQLLEI